MHMRWEGNRVETFRVAQLVLPAVLVAGRNFVAATAAVSLSYGELFAHALFKC